MVPFLSADSNTPGIEGLCRVLMTDSDHEQRKRAAWRLGEAGDARAITFLVRALGDPEWLVQREATRALGELKDVRAVEGLRAATADVNSSVRDEAARSLNTIVRAHTRMSRFESIASQHREGEP